MERRNSNHRGGDFWKILLETNDIIGKKNIEQAIIQKTKLSPKVQINSEANCEMLNDLYDEITRLKDENLILKNIILRQEETDN